MAERATFSSDVLAHAPQLFAHALRTTGNRADAEDLLQETYLRAWRGYEGFTEGTNLRAWLFRIMTNLYINRYNQQRRRPEEESLEEIEDFYLYKRIVGDGALGGGTADSAEISLLSRLGDDEVRAALDSLPALHRQLVLLRDVEGFTYAEIAGMLEIPPGTVMSGLHRARNALEKALHDFAVDNGLVTA